MRFILDLITLTASTIIPVLHVKQLLGKLSAVISRLKSMCPGVVERTSRNSLLFLLQSRDWWMFVKENPGKKKLTMWTILRCKRPIFEKQLFVYSAQKLKLVILRNIPGWCSQRQKNERNILLIIYNFLQLQSWY